MECKAAAVQAAAVGEIGNAVAALVAGVDDDDFAKRTCPASHGQLIVDRLRKCTPPTPNHRGPDAIYRAGLSTIRQKAIAQNGALRRTTAHFSRCVIYRKSGQFRRARSFPSIPARFRSIATCPASHALSRFACPRASTVESRLRRPCSATSMQRDIRHRVYFWSLDGSGFGPGPA
jgi:hypothetical protein